MRIIHLTEPTDYLQLRQADFGYIQLCWQEHAELINRQDVVYSGVAKHAPNKDELFWFQMHDDITSEERGFSSVLEKPVYLLIRPNPLLMESIVEYHNTAVKFTTNGADYDKDNIPRRISGEAYYNRGNYKTPTYFQMWKYMEAVSVIDVDGEVVAWFQFPYVVPSHCQQCNKVIWYTTRYCRRCET